MYTLDRPIVPHSLKMKLSIFLFVVLSSWKATNAFLPSQARAFTLATTKPTTSSSLNADAEHDNVSDFRKGHRQGRNGAAEVRTLSYFLLCPYALDIPLRWCHFLSDYLTLLLSHCIIRSIEH